MSRRSDVMDDFDDPSPASIERAREAQARERVAFVQAVGGDVIGVSSDGKIQRKQETADGRPNVQAQPR